MEEGEDWMKRNGISVEWLRILFADITAERSSTKVDFRFRGDRSREQRLAEADVRRLVGSSWWRRERNEISV
jgi:hypothetical protein